MDDVLAAKISSMVILAVGSLFLGLIPIKLIQYLPTHNLKARYTTSVLLCFGGGVLFSTCFTHILPEAREGFIDTGNEELEEKPVAEILLCVGFFLIYLIEELVHKFFDTNPHDLHKKQDVLRAFSINTINCHPEDINKLESKYMQQIDNTAPDAPKSMETPKGEIRKLDTNSKQAYSTFDNESLSSKSSKDSVHIFSTSSVRDFLTILALSIHSIFEGLAIGLEKDSEDVWTLFAAVATHKFVISFSLGMELAESGTKKSLHIMYMTTWGLMSPLGIGIGIAIIAGEGDYNSIANSVLQCLAGGTILYVVVFEVLERERSKDLSGLIQLLAVVCGFTAMMCVDLFLHHHHESEGVETTTSLSPTTEQMFA